MESGGIGFVLKTQNPFVTTMYHVDKYPAGDGKLRPIIKKELNNGGDFDRDSSWRMYHGREVPGFPAHPHRGFETVTVVLKGTVDHTDGLGSKGRYQNGDVQWMTAGRGLQHSEMFPLLETNKDNPLELFQIWLSLDSKHRMVKPGYKMLWKEDIPVVTFTDKTGLKVTITVIAGELGGEIPPKPPIDSWARDKKHHTSIQIIELEPGASYNIPQGKSTINRSLYFYNGEKLLLDDQLFSKTSYAFVTPDSETIIQNKGAVPAKVLLLEAEPIPEPIISRGPFVMTTEDEIFQAYDDYEEDYFGGWPFSNFEICHDINQKRFAKYENGLVEYPDKRGVGSLNK